MKIHNIRFGFATNSSSTHSMIFLPGQKDYLIGDYFGWGNFIAASKKSKELYLACLLRSSMEAPDEIFSSILKDWVSKDSAKKEYSFNGISIDHQSIMTLPRKYGTEFPDRSFFNELKKFMLQDNLVILGGNDNSEEKDRHPLSDDTEFKLQIPRENNTENWVCRYDKKYEYWVLFNQKDGTKIRFSFESPQTPENPSKSTLPELLDIKLTNFCTNNCPFCYQNSNVNGKHSEMSSYDLAKMVSEMEVFEVAIGGGEPLSHPNFIEYLRDFREMGIIPNFSTKNIDWLMDNRKWPKIIEYIGSFAFSASSVADVQKLSYLLEYNGIDKIKANIQLIPAIIDGWNFSSILREANNKYIRVTLLGFKEKGRGVMTGDYKDNESKVFDIIKDLSSKGECPYISIDTTLASKYEHKLKELDIPQWLFHTDEGKFSAYFDAIERKFGPSSFCDDAEMVDIEEYCEVKKLEEIYAGF